MTVRNSGETPAIQSLPEVEKALAEIRIERQVRDAVEEDPDIVRLGEDIKANGLHCPPIIDPAGLLIIGERRVRGMRAVGIMRATFKVYSGPLTETTRILLQTSENIQRKALKAHELSAAMLKLKELNPTWTNKELAERHLHLDPSSVVRYLAVTDCIPEVQEAYMAGGLRLTSMYAISKLSREEQAEALALALSGRNRDQLERHGRKKRNGTPAIRVSRIKCPLPSGAVVQISGERMTLDDMIEAMVELLKQAKRASEQGLDAKTFERVCRDTSKKG